MDKIINAPAFEAFAVKAFKLTDEDLASLYNDAGELTDFTLFEKKDTERITKLSTDSKNQYSRGLKEGASKLEKELKAKYEVETDLIGVDLFDHIIETKLSDVKAPEGDIMKNPEVIKLVNQHSKEKKALEKEWQQKLTEKELNINKENLFNKVKASALAEFRNLNPILPGDAKKTQALEEVFINELKRFNYQDDGESPVVLKSDGTPLMDDHGYPVTFQNHVKTNAEKYFDFKKAEERSSSGNTNQTSGAAGKKVRMPKDEADYVTMMRDNSLTPQERIEIKNLFTKK